MPRSPHVRLSRLTGAAPGRAAPSPRCGRRWGARKQGAGAAQSEIGRQALLGLVGRHHRRRGPFRSGVQTVGPVFTDCVEKPRNPVCRKSCRNALSAWLLSAMLRGDAGEAGDGKTAKSRGPPLLNSIRPPKALIFRGRRRKRTFSTQSVESCRKPIARRRPFVVLADRCLALRSEKGQGAAHQRDALEGACAARRLAAICAGQRRTTGWPVGFDSPWTAARRPARG
jgi:hypothetical protein